MYEYSAGLTSIVNVRSSEDKNIHTNYSHLFVVSKMFYHFLLSDLLRERAR